MHTHEARGEGELRGCGNKAQGGSRGCPAGGGDRQECSQGWVAAQGEENYTEELFHAGAVCWRL